MASETDEKTQLLQTFPNEVWEKILKNVKNSKDFQTISSASPQFDNLLRSLATQILFAEVIKIVVNHKNDAYFYNYCQWMRTRKVCRAWRDGLDKEFQTQQYFQQQEHELMFETRGMTFDDNCFSDFKTAQNFAKFKKHFEFDPSYYAGKKNPFPSRKIYLTFKQEEENDDDDEDAYNLEQYYTACLHFLENFGIHIWYCIVRQNLRNTADLVNFFNQWLPKILRLIPNLRGFEIDGRYLPGPIQCLFENAGTFPTLPSLEYLSLREIPVSISQELILSNPQLQHVDSSEDFELVPICLQFLPQLKQICFAVREKRDFELLRSCQFVSRVEYLWLDIKLLQQTSWYQIFQVLETDFSQSLTELHLSLPIPGTRDRSCRLKLPHVNKLHLELEYQVPLNFLLKMSKTLKELHLAIPDGIPYFRSGVDSDSDDSDEQEEEKSVFINLYNFWSEPEKSNIWEYFPKPFYPNKRFGILVRHPEPVGTPNKMMWFASLRNPKTYFVSLLAAPL